MMNTKSADKKSSSRYSRHVHVRIEDSTAPVAVAPNGIIGKRTGHVLDLLQRRVQAAERHDQARRFQPRGRPYIPRESQPIAGLLPMEVPLTLHEVLTVSDKASLAGNVQDFKEFCQKHCQNQYRERLFSGLKLMRGRGCGGASQPPKKWWLKPLPN